jgi:glycosyltransferase involved in cell wall biosynthesis
MSSPTVSILVTVFNREKILDETINSLLCSSYRDFEVVMVDDCSTDLSWDVCERASRIDARFRSYRNSSNLGDYANRNRAASLAAGKYLKYLDADDLIYRHSLATMVDAMEQFSDAALALSQNVMDPDEPYPRFYTPRAFFREHYFGRSPIGVGPSSAIIRRECFEEVGGFSGRQFVGDTELWMKLAERWPIVTLPPALVWWRKHPGQQMQLELKKPEVLNTRFELELEALRLTAHLTDQEKREARHKIRHTHARRLISFGVRMRRPTDAWALSRSAGLSFAELLRGLRRWH